MTGGSSGSAFKIQFGGDSVVNPGEEWDDGNKDDTDDCLSTCEVNLGAPNVSEWGLVAGALVIARRRRVLQPGMPCTVLP